MSVNATPVIARSLGLLTTTVKRVMPPTFPELGLNDLAMVGFAKILVVSLDALFAAFAAGSPPPLTVAVLTNVAGALAATLTVTVMAGKLAPTANGRAGL